MKRHFSHILLFLALIGNISHAFHDHYGHETDEQTLGGASSCPICIVEDLNEITHESRVIVHQTLHIVIDIVGPSILHHYRDIPHYNTRAPPSC